MRTGAAAPLGAQLRAGVQYVDTGAGPLGGTTGLTAGGGDALAGTQSEGGVSAVAPGAGCHGASWVSWAASVRRHRPASSDRMVAR
jgi:hypothetical protein